jgi:hypothetical protein
VVNVTINFPHLPRIPPQNYQHFRTENLQNPCKNATPRP